MHADDKRAYQPPSCTRSTAAAFASALDDMQARLAKLETPPRLKAAG
jgi:hypothetical protein